MAYSQLAMPDSLEQVLQQPGLSKKEQVDVLLQLSDLYLSRNPDKSFEYSKQAVFISSSLNEPELLGKSYRSLGNFYSDKGEQDSSRFFLEKALVYIPDDPLSYFFLGQNEWFNGDYMVSNRYYVLAEKAAIQRSDLKTLASIYTAFSEYYRYNQDFVLAQHYIDLSLRILERSTLYGDQAMAYNIQAEIYRTKGDYENALKVYTKTARIAYQILDSNRIGYCFSRMGYIYYMQDDFYHAEIYLVKSLELAEKVKGRHLKLFALKALADMYSNIGNIDKCKEYTRLCLTAGVELEDPTAEALAYSALSNLFYRTHQKDSAAIYADKAYVIAKENNDDINILNAILNKLPLEFENDQFEQVIRLTKEGIELVKQTETMEHLRDLYKYQYQSYEETGRNADAFIAFKKYKMYEDSLQNTNVNVGLHTSLLEMSYQDKHLTDTLIYLENTQRAEQEILLQKQRSEFFIAIGLIVAGLLFIIIFIIWTTSIKRKKMNFSLAESNQDKELLLKEIHHRVKNSLQTVSSLLNLQKTKADNGILHALIDESQLKINNIAIVHELLYQSSSFRKINLKDYVNKLTDHIRTTYADEKKEINIIKNIEPIEISLDKSVPLALIINEIVTNSFKYAFNNRESGIIEINCRKTDNRVWVEIKDNGVGLPDHQSVDTGMGFVLIEGFVRQLKGELNYGTNNGCFFVFSFPDKEKV
jgi:two-component sensor histidine kinase